MCIASLCDEPEVRAGWKTQCASKKYVKCVGSLCDQSEVRAGWKIQCVSKKVCLINRKSKMIKLDRGVIQRIR